MIVLHSEAPKTQLGVGEAGGKCSELLCCAALRALCKSENVCF